MDKSSFLQSLKYDDAPLDISLYATALWHDAKGNWEKAHEIVQDLRDTRAARIHAYLHRKEGDIFNADYWYQRADAVRPSVSLSEEWNLLVDDLM